MSQYNYNYNYIEPLAMVDKLPPDENFSFPWIVLTAKQAIKISINTIIVNLDNLGSGRVEDDVKAFLWRIFLQTLQSQGTSFKLKLLSKLKELFPAQAARGATSDIEFPGIAHPNEDIAVAVPRGIETALAQLLAETGATEVRSVSFSPDGKLLATADDPYGKVRLWKIDNIDELLDRGCVWLKEYLTSHSDAPKVCPYQ